MGFGVKLILGLEVNTQKFFGGFVRYSFTPFLFGENEGVSTAYYHIFLCASRGSPMVVASPNNLSEERRVEGVGGRPVGGQAFFYSFMARGGKRGHPSKRVACKLGSGISRYRKKKLIEDSRLFVGGIDAGLIGRLFPGKKMR